MASIVTVHGTFASGSAEGRKWWQRGSRFTSQLSTRVKGRDSPVQIDPHIWDGRNSETARRDAGRSLAQKLDDLDRSGVPFVVIGHSHGGSVISAALLHTARKRRPLSGLRSWMTVGTPFIRTKRQRFLFSRLGVFGKAIYLTLLTFFLLGALAMFVQAENRTLKDWMMALVFFCGPFALFYLLLQYLEARRSVGFNRRVVHFAKQNYGARWLSLWHNKDEAMQSLKAVKGLDVNIFSRDFAVSAFNLLAIAFVPLIFIFVLASESMMNSIAEQTFNRFDLTPPDHIKNAVGKDIFTNAAVLLMAIFVWPASLFFPDMAFIEDLPETAQYGLIIMSVMVLILVAVTLTWLFNGLAILLSNGLSRVLNPITLAQLKAVAYGSDSQEDLAVDASEWPVWLNLGFPPLPNIVAKGLEASSDAAIGQAIPKFRNVVERLGMAESPEATSDVLADYLTWKELIHTSYFDDERIAKLIAFAISRCDGFEPTDTFRRDPDYGLIERSYHEIVSSRVEKS